MINRIISPISLHECFDYKYYVLGDDMIISPTNHAQENQVKNRALELERFLVSQSPKDRE